MSRPEGSLHIDSVALHVVSVAQATPSRVRGRGNDSIGRGIYRPFLVDVAVACVYSDLCKEACVNE